MHEFRAAGYRLVKGALKNQGGVSPSRNTTADGALYFIVLDPAKWDAALYTEEPAVTALFHDPLITAASFPLPCP